MGSIRFFIFLIFAYTYYVQCNCKFSAQNNHHLNEPSQQFRQRNSASVIDHFRKAARQKRSEQYDTLVFEIPSTEVDAATHPGFDRIHSNDYNRIVSALKEMLRAREEKNVVLRPRPGRRSTSDASPLWHYLMDDVDNLGLRTFDTVALVGDMGDSLADTALKKSAPFKPRLGKRVGNRICE